MTILSLTIPYWVKLFLNMKSKNEILATLPFFTGTDEYHYHPHFNEYMVTDGVKFLMDSANCYWLIAHIFMHQSMDSISNEPVQIWKLIVNPDRSARISTTDGNGKLLRTFDIPFTTFPLNGIELYMEGKVLLLPTEH